MTTQPQDPQRLKALELALQARREPLASGDAEFLKQALRADPSLEAEIAEMSAFLGDLEPARVTGRPAFKDRLDSALSSWVRDAAFAGPVTTGTRSRNPVLRGWQWLFGRDVGQRDVSTSTLFLGRSLAVYLGAASVLAAVLLLGDPAASPEAAPIDRAERPDVEAPKPDIRREPKEELRTRKGR